MNPCLTATQHLFMHETYAYIMSLKILYTLNCLQFFKTNALSLSWFILTCQYNHFIQLFQHANDLVYFRYQSKHNFCIHLLKT